MLAREKKFNTFYELNKRRAYYNEIKEYSKLSHSSLQNALKQLIEVDVSGGILLYNLVHYNHTPCLHKICVLKYYIQPCRVLLQTCQVISNLTG